METKKHPQADLNRDSGLFFVIGLALVLFTIWRALEYKSYDTIRQVVVEHQVLSDLREEVPITETIKTLPPPTPPVSYTHLTLPTIYSV